MYKACSRCGKIHDTRYKCNSGIKYDNVNTEERAQRNKYAWALKSREIRQKAQYLCEVCRDKGTYTYDGIEVHHIIKLRDNPNGLLDNNNLVCLCGMHHRLADNGQVDIEYLRKLAENREKKYQ